MSKKKEIYTSTKISDLALRSFIPKKFQKTFANVTYPSGFTEITLSHPFFLAVINVQDKGAYIGALGTFLLENEYLSSYILIPVRVYDKLSCTEIPDLSIRGTYLALLEFVDV